MRVDRFRIPCFLDVTFKVTGIPFEFTNELTKNKYLPILNGTTPGRFSSYIGKDHFPENGPAKQPEELEHLARLEINMFLRRILSLDNQYNPNLTITIIKIELTHNDIEDRRPVRP